MQNSFKEFIDPSINEGIDPDAKRIMKVLNQQIALLKEDVKESDSNGNWIGRMKGLKDLLDRSIKRAESSQK